MSLQRTPINPNTAPAPTWWQKRFGDLSRPLKWSLIVHGLIALLAVVGLPKWGQEKPLIPMAPIAVDLVNMGEYTMATNTAKAKGPNNLKPAQPKPAKAPEVKPAEPKAEPKPEPKAEPEPEKPKPAPKTEPKPDVIKEKIPDKKAEKKPEKKPEPKKEEKPKDKPKADDFDSVLKNLSTAEDKPKDKPKPKADTKPEDFDNLLKDLAGEATAPESDGETLDTDNIDPNKPSGLAPMTGDSLSISALDALQYQLARCWNPPAGAADAEDLVVEVRIVVRPDRTVESATIVDTGRYASDAFFRAAADSARRAVLNPNCSPLVLPPEKYDIWKNVVVRFNPKQMLGG
jgi:outer membrane biosynthesis protein TonB